MPEGDTIHHAANVIRPVLEGRVPDELRTPQRRHERDRWPERLRGRAVQSRRGARQAPAAALRRRPRHALAPADDRRVGGLRRGRALAALAAARVARDRAQGREVVQFDGPLLELMTRGAHAQRRAPGGARAGHPRRALRRGARCSRRIREDDPTRAVRRRAHRSAHARRASGTSGSPSRASRRRWTPGSGSRRPPTRRSSPRCATRASTWRSRRATASSRVRAPSTGARARPARAAATPIRSGGQGEQNRTTYWCPQCQR